MMERMTLSVTMLLGTLLAHAQFVHKGELAGVEMATRWQHPLGKPSQLQLKLKNNTAEDRQVDLIIDLHYQGRTVESWIADTCIKAGETMIGKAGGLQFISTRLTSEQIKSGDAEADLTRSEVTKSQCP